MFEVLQLIVWQEPPGLVVVLSRVAVAHEQDLSFRDDRHIGHQRVNATFFVDAVRLPTRSQWPGGRFRQKYFAEASRRRRRDLLNAEATTVGITAHAPTQSRSRTDESSRSWPQ